jgi:hypothetical protein
MGTMNKAAFFPFCSPPTPTSLEPNRKRLWLFASLVQRFFWLQIETVKEAE